MKKISIFIITMAIIISTNTVKAYEYELDTPYLPYFDAFGFKLGQCLENTAETNDILFEMETPTTLWFSSSVNKRSVKDITLAFVKSKYRTKLYYVFVEFDKRYADIYEIKRIVDSSGIKHKVKRNGVNEYGIYVYEIETVVYAPLEKDREVIVTCKAVDQRKASDGRLWLEFTTLETEIELDIIKKKMDAEFVKDLMKLTKKK